MVPRIQYESLTLCSIRIEMYFLRFATLLSLLFAAVGFGAGWLDEAPKLRFTTISV